MVTLPLIYHSLLGGRPDHVIRLAGALLVCAAIAMLRVQTSAQLSQPSPPELKS